MTETKPKKKSLRDAIHPRGNLVLLEMLDRSKTASGLLLPESAQKPSGERAELFYYRVLRVGPGMWSNQMGKRIPIELEEGQLVAVNPGAAFSMPEWEAHKLALCPEGEIYTTMDDYDDDTSPAVVLPGANGMRLLS